MYEVFKRTTNSIICSSVIAFVIGLIMLFNPSISIKTISIVAAIYIIIHGLILVILDIKAEQYYLPFDGMLPGILSILIGIILVCKPNILSTIFIIVIGVWIVLQSINSIKIAMVLRSEDAPWLFLLLLGMLDLVVGVIVVFNPFEASISLTMFAGAMIVVHSIINVVDMLVIKRDAKKISKAIGQRIKRI